MAEEIAWTHHEKWDGTGYPRGLSGEAIPLEGRIMAVADVYDALRSRRVYKPAVGHREACKIILADSGHHFDPSVLIAFECQQEKFCDISNRLADRENESHEFWIKRELVNQEGL